MRYLRVLGCDADEVDDLAQEVLLRWWRSGGPSRPERTGAWLFRVTKNVFIDRHRRRREPRLESWTERVEEAVAATWAPDGGDAWVDAAQQCAAGLPERTARLVQLFYIEGRSREEIARELGMRPNGVKTGLQRARAALRQCIEARLR